MATASSSSSSPSSAALVATDNDGKNKGSGLNLLGDVYRLQRPEWQSKLQAAKERLRNLQRRPQHAETVMRVLRGHEQETELPAPSRVVRLFISSTFTDTAAERDLLIDDVYPYFREFGRVLGLEFQQPSEMRWGIRQAASDDHETAATCMQEIARCQKESCAINYVLLLGNKYGFRPFPAVIAEDEYAALRAVVAKNSRTDLALLEEWFLRDANQVPPVFRLQSAAKAAKGAWWGDAENPGIFPRLQRMLRKAAKKAKGLSEERRMAYTQSVTAEEVLNGLVQAERTTLLAKTLVYIRDLSWPKASLAHPKAKLYIDMEGNKVDAKAQKLLDTLKKKTVPSVLRAAGAGPRGEAQGCVHFQVPQGPEILFTNSAQAEYLRRFADDFASRICDSMQRAAEAMHVEPDEVFEEARAHALKAHADAAGLCTTPAVQALLDRIAAHMRGAAVPAPGAATTTPAAALPLLVVHGASGSGKTSLMAQAILAAKAAQPASVVLARFLGTTAASSNSLDLLRNLCAHLLRLGATAEALCPAGKLPSKLETLVEAWPLLLASLATSSGQPVLLFLDSLDQLSDTHNGRQLTWLPPQFPPNVRVVLSTLPEEGGCLRTLQARQLPAACFLPVLPFTASEGQAIMQATLTAERRALTAEQSAYILSLFKENPYPLFLKVALERSKKWRSYTATADFMNLAPNLFDLLQGLMQTHLSVRHGPVVIEVSLGLLTLAQEGLADTEMEDILSANDDVLSEVYEWWTPPVRRLPPLLWARIVTDLQPWLVLRKGGQASTAATRTWYHRQFAAAARRIFLGTETQRRQRAQELADYFSAKWVKGKPISISAGPAASTKAKENPDQAEKPIDRKLPEMPDILSGQLGESDAVYNRRKFVELPAALLELQDTDKLLRLCLANIPFLEAACAAGMAPALSQVFLQARPLERTCSELSSLREFFIARAAYFALHPSAVFQECADQPVETPAFKAAEALDKTGRVFNHWMNKPTVPSLCRMSIQGPEGVWAHCVAFAPDGSTLACGTGDNKLRLWQLDSSTCNLVLSAKESAVEVCAFSPSGHYIACGEAKGSLSVFDAKTGMTLSCWSAFESRYPCKKLLFVSTPPREWQTSEADSLLLAAGGNRVDLINWRTQKVLTTFPGRTEFQQDANTGQPIKSLPHTIKAFALARRDTLLLVAGSDNLVTVWDVARSSIVKTFSRHAELKKGGDLSTCELAPDDRTVCSISFMNSSLVWDLDTLTVRLDLKTDMLTNARFSPCGRYLLLFTRIADKQVLLYNAHSLEHIANMEVGSHDIRSVTMRPRVMISGLAQETAGVPTMEAEADEHVFASCSSSGLIKLLRYPTTAEEAALHSSTLGFEIGFATAASPCGQFVVVGGREGTTRLFDTVAGKCHTTVPKEEGSTTIDRVAFSGDSGYFATGDRNGGIHLYTATGERLRSFREHPRGISALMINPLDVNFLLASSEGVPLVVWDIRENYAVYQLVDFNAVAGLPADHGGPTTALAHNKDFTRLLAARARPMRPGPQEASEQDPHMICLLAVEPAPTFKVTVLPLRLHGHTSGIISVEFHPLDERLAVSAGWDKTARVWDLQSGACLAELGLHPDRVVGATFALSCAQVATLTQPPALAAPPATAAVDTGTTGTPAPNMPVEQLRVVTVCFDGRFRLWDVKQRQLLATVYNFTDGGQFFHCCTLPRLSFCPDQTLATIAAASTAGTCLIEYVMEGNVVLKDAPVEDAAANVEEQKEEAATPAAT